MTKNSDRHNERHSLANQFAQLAQKTAQWTGHPTAFLLASAVVLVWIVSGPLFGYSDTWQLVINTGTTIVTFLMVFLIQNTQNRDMVSMQLKLSELVLAMKGAENKFASLEDLSDDELEALHEECRARADMTLKNLEGRHSKDGRPAAADNAKTQHLKTRPLKRKSIKKSQKAA
ncbi:MAG: low affinity iron permease family protein [Pseudolabrys sp.]|nr:low affinity iron permease family protein [Pseudolabrys sp.]